MGGPMGFAPAQFMLAFSVSTRIARKGAFRTKIGKSWSEVLGLQILNLNASEFLFVSDVMCLQKPIWNDAIRKSWDGGGLGPPNSSLIGI